MGEHHDSVLARAALVMAAATRGGDVEGVVFHSDKGGEYHGDIFVEACESLGVTRSMSRIGSALDNARGRVVQLDSRVGAVVAADLRDQRPSPPRDRGVHRQLQPPAPAFQLRDAGAGCLRTSPRGPGRPKSRPGGSGLKHRPSDRRTRPRSHPMASRCGHMRGFKPNQQPSTKRGEPALLAEGGGGDARRGGMCPITRARA